MALRNFTDEHGRAWRAWDVTPESLHPTTRAEDYMRDYLDGWLAFETTDSSTKCRLVPIPPRWVEASEDTLRTWLHRAAPVRVERTSGPHGRAGLEAVALAEAAAIGAGRVPQSRTFRFAGGRFWSVAEFEKLDHRTGADGTPRRVLRFTAGSRNLDLSDWPANWSSYSDEQLAQLLADEFPRGSGRQNLTPHRRRAGDPPPDAARRP